MTERDLQVVEPDDEALGLFLTHLLQQPERPEGDEQEPAPGQVWHNSTEGLTAHVEDLSRNGRYVIVRVDYVGGPRLRVFERDRFIVAYAPLRDPEED